MITLYWIEGKLNGEHVCGFQLATSPAEARRLARHYAGARQTRGRPRRGQPRLEITSVEVAA